MYLQQTKRANSPASWLILSSISCSSEPDAMMVNVSYLLVYVLMSQYCYCINQSGCVMLEGQDEIRKEPKLNCCINNRASGPTCCLNPCPNVKG